ncbi:sulfatase-like hydrolase/transferase [bacterium]|jgi:hypothetical protein|nr:sulfatase-like hydrolase/transferase [bacterium]
MEIWTRIKRGLGKILPMQTSRFVKFMVFLQFYYIYQVVATNDVGGMSFSVGSIAMLVGSMASVWAYFQLWNVLFSGSKRLNFIANVAGLLFYDLLIAYQFGSHEELDYSVIADNATSAFSPEAFDVIINSLDVGALQYFVLIVLVFGFLERQRRTITLKGMQSSPVRWKLLGAVVLYGFFLLNPWGSLDPNVNFIRSGIRYYTDVVDRKVVVLPEDLPLLNSDGRNLLSGSIPKPKKAPHVFLIIVESLNASALGASSPKGVAYTPYMNTLNKRAMSVEPFYANSVQTAKGHFATLFAVTPSMRGKAFTRYPDLRIKSIGSALQENGYGTSIFAAHHDKGFDNTAGFLSRDRGFDRFDIVEPWLSKKERAQKMKWGVEDKVFFRRFFDYLADWNQTTPSSPKFVVLTTIANHFPFNSMSDDRKLVYPDASGIRQNYANSVRLVDEGIKVFFEELDRRGLAEDSIVIITGDHSFPMGEHGNYHLEAGYHDESFRIPFFLYWKGKVAPKRIARAHSQLDIAPTILDLLSINPGPNTLQGRSIIDKKAAQHPIYLVQPYSGKHLSIIQWPYKYRYFSKTGQEYFYHLEEDPMENKNRIDSLSPERLQMYREGIQKMYISQFVIEKDQLLPK